MKSRKQIASKKARMLEYANKTRLKGRSRKGVIIQTRDFSEVEDDPGAFQIIKQLGARAAQSAEAEAKAAGLSRIFVRNNQIIRLHPDGTEEVVVTPLPRGNKYYFYYKPATVLHAGKK